MTTRLSNAKFDPMEALHRASLSDSKANYGTIIDGFTQMGIPQEEIEPRVNVFTYGAWMAMNRRVKPGQQGVQIQTRIPVQVLGAKTKTGEIVIHTRLEPQSATVYHVSQTEPMERSAS